MRRLFTREEVLAYLDAIQAYTQAEFGDEDTLPVSFLHRHLTEGVDFYQPYGDFSEFPPRVMGLVNFFLISHAEYQAIRNGERREAELAPWKPEDGQAVLWLCSVVSEVSGVACKCVSAIMDQIAQHPYKSRIDKTAAICTGPQGYLMARAFDLKESGKQYGDGWAFMERDVAPGEIDSNITRGLEALWNMTKARDVVRSGREMFGEKWKHAALNFRKPIER